jgi:hypothetical protein
MHNIASAHVLGLFLGIKTCLQFDINCFQLWNLNVRATVCVALPFCASRKSHKTFMFILRTIIMYYFNPSRPKKWRTWIFYSIIPSKDNILNMRNWNILQVWTCAMNWLCCCKFEHVLWIDCVRVCNKQMGSARMLFLIVISDTTMYLGHCFVLDHNELLQDICREIITISHLSSEAFGLKSLWHKVCSSS